VDFGVQSKDALADPGVQNTNQPKSTSPLFGIFGGLLLLGGAALGYYAWRSGKPESKLSGGMLKK
jgi:hypothetical protein